MKTDLDIRGFRKQHFRQLLDYILSRDETGWYYGNKEQFERRHGELLTWAEDLCERSNRMGKK